MTSGECRENDETSRPPKPHPLDLEERTAAFGEAVIRFAKGMSYDAVGAPLITQLVRSATSVGANYCEADDAGSRKEFRHRISICRKEAREAKHWLRMVVAADGRLREQAKPLWKEAKELNLIFSAIFRNTTP